MVLACAHRGTTVVSWGLCEQAMTVCPLPSPLLVRLSLFMRAACLISHCACPTRVF
jgi:hypothetical protein